MGDNSETVFVQLQNVRAQIKSFQQQETALEAIVLDAYNIQIKSQLAEKDYGCGTATITLGDGRKVKVVIGKLVKWNQAETAVLYNRFGDEYIRADYKVEESKWNAWPSDLKDIFVHARTVTPSKPKITIED